MCLHPVTIKHTEIQQDMSIISPLKGSFWPHSANKARLEQQEPSSTAARCLFTFNALSCCLQINPANKTREINTEKLPRNNKKAQFHSVHSCVLKRRQKTRANSSPGNTEKREISARLAYLFCFIGSGGAGCNITMCFTLCGYIILLINNR